MATPNLNVITIANYELIWNAFPNEAPRMPLLVEKYLDRKASNKITHSSPMFFLNDNFDTSLKNKCTFFEEKQLSITQPAVCRKTAAVDALDAHRD